MNKEEKEALLNLLRNNLIKLGKPDSLYLLFDCKIHENNCLSCHLEKRICMAERNSEMSNKILDFLNNEYIEELL